MRYASTWMALTNECVLQSIFRAADAIGKYYLSTDGRNIV
jgi:hypothetical protein